MSKANPVDQKQFPLGRILFVGGLIAIVLVIAFTFGRIYAGTRAVLAEITSPEPAQFDLPAGEYILTRSEGVGSDSGLAVTLDSVYGAFTPDENDRWMSFGDQRNRILGNVSTTTSGTITLAVNADAYPIAIRHDPQTLIMRVMVHSAILGSIAAIMTTIGAFIAIRRFNETQRRSRQAFQALMDDKA